jgi:hypothetical protein
LSSNWAALQHSTFVIFANIETTMGLTEFAPPPIEIIVAVPVCCGMLGCVKGIEGLFLDIWDLRSAAKGAFAKPPPVLFWSIENAGHASQVVDFHDNSG